MSLVRFEPGIIGFHFKKGLETPFSYLELSHSGRKNDLGSSYESTDQYEGMTHGMTHHNDSFTTMNQRRISLEQKARDRRIEIKPANQRPSSEKTIPDGYYAVSIKIIKIDYGKIRTCDVRFTKFFRWGIY